MVIRPSKMTMFKKGDTEYIKTLNRKSSKDGLNKGQPPLVKLLRGIHYFIGFCVFTYIGC